MRSKYLYFVCTMCLLSAGCTMRQAGYTALGAGTGGGIGYSLLAAFKKIPNMA